MSSAFPINGYHPPAPLQQDPGTRFEFNQDVSVLRGLHYEMAAFDYQNEYRRLLQAIPSYTYPNDKNLEFYKWYRYALSLILPTTYRTQPDDIRKIILSRISLELQERVASYFSPRSLKAVPFDEIVLYMSENFRRHISLFELRQRALSHDPASNGITVRQLEDRNALITDAKLGNVDAAELRDIYVTVNVFDMAKNTDAVLTVEQCWFRGEAYDLEHLISDCKFLDADRTTLEPGTNSFSAKIERFKEAFDQSPFSIAAPSQIRYILLCTYAFHPTNDRVYHNMLKPSWEAGKLSMEAISKVARCAESFRRMTSKHTVNGAVTGGSTSSYASVTKAPPPTPCRHCRGIHWHCDCPELRKRGHKCSSHSH